VGWVKAKPFVGEWEGLIDWHPDWALELMNPQNKREGFIPDNPRAEGDVGIYCSSRGVYKCSAFWTLKHGENVFSLSVVIGSEFIFSTDKKLESFIFKAHVRAIVEPGAEMGGSKLYTVVVTDQSADHITGNMILPLSNDRVIGVLKLKRI